MRIAVLGAGISGLGSAYILSKKHDVDLYEKENRLGGHARTTIVQQDDNFFGVDTGFLVFNYATYPLLTKLFKELDVKIENSDMSFAFWDINKNIAYNGSSLKGIFAQKRNLFSFTHYKMISDILSFNKKANRDLMIESKDLDKTLGEYIKDYSYAFKNRYLLPMGASIWSTPSEEMNNFPARTFLNFFKNHGLLGVSSHHQWLTVSNGSINYVEKIKDKISGKIFLNSDVIKIKRVKNGVYLIHKDGRKTFYDKVVLAMHAPEALEILEDASPKEVEILSAFKYKENRAVLHSDNNILHPNRKMYAAWNYTSSNLENKAVTLTYWINALQNLKTKKDYFVSLNETKSIKNVIENISYEHPQFDLKAILMQSRKDEICGVNNTYYAGAYWRYGFHEDGLLSATKVASKLMSEF
ncbi:FAD-dependent oxidoreductase [Aliarcobacter cryaerophilus ATCC 43158]|uniref:NAD/FAD-binding protein n=1 Tax=Aliarcobacter cryaerophilus ATCC 43158 TaxID=1032070 RepID=A0AAD0X9V7_9BACT|nr:FAD-dependent oxidoreductase [Aliarcobacter cryaerophilus]AYJ79628.1 NAD/FAD-binding protein [Aliarcobacter cryaerophilus ATCC 43158]PRM95258.1 FAD-dependent oxidoreductase [Aliarcobacter cryaerophilus]QCZ23869.1 FAD-dependent oxidoreductase [Aliarcobacter cryaerophilus ATCC 43158]